MVIGGEELGTKINGRRESGTIPWEAGPFCSVSSTGRPPSTPRLLPNGVDIVAQALDALCRTDHRQSFSCHPVVHCRRRCKLRSPVLQRYAVDMSSLTLSLLLVHMTLLQGFHAGVERPTSDPRTPYARDLTARMCMNEGTQLHRGEARGDAYAYGTFPCPCYKLQL